MCDTVDFSPDLDAIFTNGERKLPRRAASFAHRGRAAKEEIMEQKISKPVTMVNVNAINNIAEGRPSLNEPVNEMIRSDALFPSGNQPVSASSVTPAKPHGPKRGSIDKSWSPRHRVASTGQVGGVPKKRIKSTTTKRQPSKKIHVK